MMESPAIYKSMVFAWVSWRKIIELWVSSEAFAKNSAAAPVTRIRGTKNTDAKTDF